MLSDANSRRKRERMIIDFHSHDFPDDVAARAMRVMCKQTEGVLWPSGDGTMTNHLDSMEKAGVDKAVLCQIATKPRQWEFILRRSVAIMSGELGERAKRRLVPFGSVHADDPDAPAHIAEFAASGVKGIKFHPYYQDFSLADPKVLPIFRKIAELGLVVECHSGVDVSWVNERGKCGPGEIAALMDAVPDLKFVAAHLGGCFRYPSHATDVLLKRGVYIDTSSLAFRWHYDEEMRLLRSWPRDRILFATDFPWVDYGEAIAHVRSVRDPSDHSAIFSDNARRLLGL